MKILDRTGYKEFNGRLLISCYFRTVTGEKMNE
jgi:hypothetical protein